MAKLNLLTAFLSGAATGVAIGMLYAPQAGDETRRQIKDQTKRTAEDVENWAADLAEDAKKTWFEARGTWDRTVGVAAEEVEDFIRHIADRGQALWTENAHSERGRNGGQHQQASTTTNEGKKKNKSKEGPSGNKGGGNEPRETGSAGDQTNNKR